MYVDMKKTYIGQDGTTFPKGWKSEVVPDSLAKKLIKDGFAVECRPPQDEKMTTTPQDKQLRPDKPKSNYRTKNN